MSTKIMKKYLFNSVMLKRKQKLYLLYLNYIDVTIVV